LAICLLTSLAVGFPSIAWYRRTKEKEYADQRIRFLAHHDALTGLANRSLFTERIEEAFNRLSQHGEAFTIILVDLDQFKSVNDSMGHPIGDALLEAAARRLRSCVRPADLVARLGGDEFAILQAVRENQNVAAIAMAKRIGEVVACLITSSNERSLLG
jgi:diguanylate cyclase (GGDEF)-like protein